MGRKCGRSSEARRSGHPIRVMKPARPAPDHREVSVDGRARGITAAVLAGLFIILVPLTTTLAWTHRTVLDTDTYVSTVAPVAADPAVIAATSRLVTDQLYQTLDIPTKVADALPANAKLLAGPIASGARDYVQQAVTRVLESDAFRELWARANRFAHTQLVAVLRGDTTVLQATGGQIALNLVPLIEAALRNMAGFVSGVVGHPISLPSASESEAPAVACAKLSAAIDRQLPSNCGVITLFRAHNLAVAQRGVRAFDRGTLLLLIVTPLVGLAALLASPRRRRTVLQLAVGGAAALIVARRLVIWTQSSLIDTGRPENKSAREAIVRQILGGYFDLTRWLLIIAIVVVVVALVTGPYRWAVRSRTAVGQTGGAVVAAVGGRSRDVRSDHAVAWANAHYDVLRFGAIAVVLLLLVAIDVNLVGFLVVAAALAVFEVGLARLRTAADPGAVPVATPPPRSGTHPQL